MKNIAPSPLLRQWFDHRSDRFSGFSSKYEHELTGNSALGELRRLGRGKLVTLLYSARDPAINHTLVRRSVLRRRASAKRPKTITHPTRR
jgi:uncharacterized protein YeaO (DUF488 family)